MALLPACSLLPSKKPEVKQVETVCVEKPKPALGLQDPKHLDASGINTRWRVLSEGETAYFCLSKEGYQSLSNLLLDMRNRLETQKELTDQYRKYYEKSVEQ